MLLTESIALHVVDKGIMGQGTVPHQELRVFVCVAAREPVRIGTLCATERRIAIFRRAIETGCRALNIQCTVTAPHPRAPRPGAPDHAA
jgi:hypothetical protein